MLRESGRIVADLVELMTGTPTSPPLTAEVTAAKTAQP